MLRAVIELMRRERRAGLRRNVIHELVALALGHAAGAGSLAGRRAGLVPGLAAVVGALNDLAEPSAGLRSVNAIGIGGRSLEVVKLPSGEVRTADLPSIALAVGGKNECSLARSHKNSNSAHIHSSAGLP